MKGRAWRVGRSDDPDRRERPDAPCSPLVQLRRQPKCGRRTRRTHLDATQRRRDLAGAPRSLPRARRSSISPTTGAALARARGAGRDRRRPRARKVHPGQLPFTGPPQDLARPGHVLSWRGPQLAEGSARQGRHTAALPPHRRGTVCGASRWHGRHRPSPVPSGHEKPSCFCQVDSRPSPRLARIFTAPRPFAAIGAARARTASCSF